MTSIEQAAAGDSGCRRPRAAGSCSGSSATFPPRSSAPRRWSSRGSSSRSGPTTPPSSRSPRSLGEIVGFYAVLAVTIYAEQAQVAKTLRGAIGRTGLLLVAEFGVAELLDTLLIRPAALMLGVWLAARPAVGPSRGQGRRRHRVLRDRGRRVHGHRQDRAARRPPQQGACRMTETLDPARAALDAALRRSAPRRGLGAARHRCRTRRGRGARHARAAARPRAHPPPVPAPAQRASVRAVPLRGQGALARRRHRRARRCRAAASTSRPATELALLERHGVDAERDHPHPPGQEAGRDRRGDRGRACAPSSSTTTLELDKFAHAPADVRLLIRLGYRSPHAKSDLSSKFGVGPFEAAHLVERARDRGIRISGFSFHVGSQLDDPRRFADAATETLELMAQLEARFGVRFDTLDIGGGFPVALRLRRRLARGGGRRAPAGARAARRAPRHHRRARADPGRRVDDPRDERRRASPSATTAAGTTSTTGCTARTRTS